MVSERIYQNFLSLVSCHRYKGILYSSYDRFFKCWQIDWLQIREFLKILKNFSIL